MSGTPRAANTSAEIRVPRVSASLRVKGDTLDPAKVTRILGVESDFSARKGEQRPMRTGVVIQSTGVWSRRVRPGPAEEWDLDRTIAALLTEIRIPLQTWQALGREYTLDVFCGLFMGRDNQGAGLRPETLQLLAERGLTLELDVYGPPTDDAVI
jgi:Domain of unknown function (DUF4279)